MKRPIYKMQANAKDIAERKAYKEKLKCGIDAAFGPSLIFVKEVRWSSAENRPPINRHAAIRPRKHVDSRIIETKQIEGDKRRGQG